MVKVNCHFIRLCICQRHYESNFIFALRNFQLLYKDGGLALMGSGLLEIFRGLQTTFNRDANIFDQITYRRIFMSYKEVCMFTCILLTYICTLQ